MGSLSKSSIGGSIHRIREFELEKVNLADEFDILQIVGEGWFGKILLVEHKATDTEMVLKALPKPYTSLRDFYREFHYGLHLGAHKNIISTYDVSFETAGFYVFSQEYAPLGDLTSNVTETGIGEVHTKRVAKQLSAALEHLHTRDLVHRDVKLDNVLVFKSDFTRIKLCDFGETRRSGTVVSRRNEWLPYAPPEVLEISTDNSYKASTSHDVWQFAIVVFVCLTGCLPWQKAALDDPRYARYLSWQTSTIPLKRQPKLFKLVSSKAQKLFKKYLEPKPEKRPAGLAEVHRFMDDRWMSKNGMEKNTEVPSEEEGLCPSMYSFHSSPEEKNKLLFTLTQYGLETTVDRSAKKDRIRNWIQNSVIEEEDEEELDSESEEDIKLKDLHSGPIGERIEDRGPVAHAGMTNGQLKRHGSLRKRASTLSLNKLPAEYRPPIDPRIPLEQQKTKMESYSNGGIPKSHSEANFPSRFGDNFVGNGIGVKENFGPGNFTSGNFGPGNFGSGNFGRGNFVSGNFASGNFASGNFGSGNTGSANSGSGNSGPGNFRPGNSGPGNFGSGNPDHENHVPGNSKSRKSDPENSRRENLEIKNSKVKCSESAFVNSDSAFKNVMVNEKPVNAFAKDVSHNINVQIPQSEQYGYFQNGKERETTPKSPLSRKKSLRDDKRFGAYAVLGGKSSSSNSNSTGKSAR